MSDIIDELSKAITTAANDDTTAPGTVWRNRNSQRILAMMAARDEIERLRAELAGEKVLEKGKIDG